MSLATFIISIFAATRVRLATVAAINSGNGSLLVRNNGTAVSPVVPAWLNGARQLADVFGILQKLGFVGMPELVAVRLPEDEG
jgi:hypothetical protein